MLRLALMFCLLIPAVSLAEPPPEDIVEEPPLDGEIGDVAPVDSPESLADLPAAPLIDAERVEGLSSSQYKYLKPKRHLLPGNPYQQVDFTAYALEWGETKLGVAGIHFGLLPRVQVGTNPVLDLVGIYNGNVKVNLFRAGPVDLGLTGGYHELPLGDFLGQYMTGGVTASWVLSEMWSVHGGVQYASVQAKGLPTAPPALFKNLVDTSMVEEWKAEADALGVDPYLRGQGTAVRAAMDFRLNRRDSIVIQGQAFTWGRLEANLGEELPDYVQEQVALIVPGLSGGSVDQSAHYSLLDAYVLTASYQISWRRVDLRIGGGQSPSTLAWVLQANDASVRFGGKTRRHEAKSKRGWRRSKDDIAEN
ncbi:MAG: hypothetical protein GWP91_10345 [Rhodobacterales bacterium]|nr:hypothetical protein [Rhodobacterales bacterium]